MCPAALHNIFIHTVDSSQFFEKWILPKQPKIINKITKSWDEDRIRVMEEDCFEPAHDFLSYFLSSKQFCLN